jgi:hypothetical protein
LFRTAACGSGTTAQRRDNGSSANNTGDAVNDPACKSNLCGVALSPGSQFGRTTTPPVKIEPRAFCGWSLCDEFGSRAFGVAFAWKMLDPTEDEQRTPGKEQTIPPIDAFYPLTLPLTVGPGSISVAITLGSQRPTMSDGLGHLLLLGTGAVAGLAAIAVTIFLCYRFADRIVAVLGASGTNVLVRLTAFILLCIGIQIVWNSLVASH